MQAKKHIIYGILNWGLGHATRSVPIIKALIANGFNPVLASDGVAHEYLKKEFPNLPHESLKSYNIKYSSRHFLMNMVSQLPGIYEAVKFENAHLKKLVSKYDPLGIISDNRLGFYHKDLPSVYITHQLKIKAPFPFSAASILHRNYIKNFDECWIPDFKEEPNLSGEMTMTNFKAMPVKFIGPLSRFHEPVLEEKKFELCIILSGPEPQRSHLEEILLQQIDNLPGPFIMIRGKEDEPISSPPSNLKVINVALAHEIPHLIAQSKMVLSRSGYSSLMDYYFLKNRALLISTPGQVEQEYLSAKLNKEGRFYSVKQNELNLEKDLPIAEKFPGFSQMENKLELRNWEDLFSLFQSKGEGRS